MKYDYLVVGSGLYGAVFACEAKKAGKKVLVIDKRPNIAGNVYTEEIEGINVHTYGAHIFHTNNKKVWDYITQYAEFNRFTNSCTFSGKSSASTLLSCASARVFSELVSMPAASAFSRTFVPATMSET